MIEWEQVEKDLRNLAHSARYEVGTTEEHAEEIFNYIKSLIAKEFKLVARGKLSINKVNIYNSPEYWQIRIIDKNDSRGFRELGELLKDYDIENISIYISESKDK